MQNITILTIIIPIIIGVIVALITFKKHNYEDVISDFFATIIITFIICLLIRCCIFILDDIDQGLNSETITYSEEYDLRCLDDYIVNKQDTSSTGAFLICAGYYSSGSENTQTYNIKYIYKNNDGVYKIDNIKDVNIDKVGFVTDGVNSIEKKYKQYKYNHRGIYAWLYNKETESTYSEAKIVEYIFHIPDNSIIDSKEIDLK